MGILKIADGYVEARLHVRRRLQEHVGVVQKLVDQSDTIVTIAHLIIASLRGGGKLIVFGNAGSAADAQHMAAELVGRYYVERAPLAAIALTVNSSILTAIANDYGYADVFKSKLAAVGQRGDVVIGISTSGRSPSVLEALRFARDKGLVTVGLTGDEGLSLEEAVEVCLKIPAID